jgi:hypothetical protein
MKKLILAVVVVLNAFAAHAAMTPVDFAGKWTFDPAQSKNVGMMAEGTIVTVITQSKAELVMDDNSVFNGQKDTQHTIYDLTGKPVPNMSMMAGKATTRSHWEAAHLVTEWESAGAIAGTLTKRVETRYLSPDGKTMYVESVRPGHEPLVMVFTKSN